MNARQQERFPIPRRGRILHARNGYIHMWRGASRKNSRPGLTEQEFEFKKVTPHILMRAFTLRKFGFLLTNATNGIGLEISAQDLPNTPHVRSPQSTVATGIQTYLSRIGTHSGN